MKKEDLVLFFFKKKNMLDFYFEECKADFTKKNIDNIL